MTRSKVRIVGDGACLFLYIEVRMLVTAAEARYRVSLGRTLSAGNKNIHTKG